MANKINWTQDQDETIQHMVVMGFHIKDISRAVGVSRNLVHRHIEDMRKNGWDGTDPTPGKAPPPGFDPPKEASWLRKYARGKALRTIDNNFKKGSFIHRVLTRKLGGDRIDGKDRKGGEVIAALNDHHRATVQALNQINASITKGYSTLNREMTALSDNVTLGLDRITDTLDRKSFGIGGNNPKPEVTPVRRAASMSELKGGKGMLAKLGLAGLGGFALSGLLSKDAKAKVDPNDRIFPTPKDDPKTQANVENRLRDQAAAIKEQIKTPLQELEIKGQDLTFRGQTITFEADEFDAKDLLGDKDNKKKGTPASSSAGDRKTDAGGSDTGATPKGGDTSGSGPGQAVGNDNANGSATGNSGAEPGSYADKLSKHMRGGGGGEKGGSGGSTDGTGAAQPPNTQSEGRDSQGRSQGFTPLPEGQSLGGGMPEGPPAPTTGDAGSAGGGAGGYPPSGSPGSGSSQGGFFSKLWGGIKNGLGFPSNEGNASGQGSKGGALPPAYNGKLPQLGLNADQFTGAGGPGQSDELASQRAGYGKQMEADPSMRETLGAMMLAEEGNDSQARKMMAESAMNRGASRGTENFGHIIRNEAYYQPYQNGSYYSQIARLRNNPQLREQINKEIDEVLKGSNHSNLATDNGSAGVKANAIARGDTITKIGDNGEAFVRKDKNPDYHGAGVVAQTKSWFEKTQARIDAENAARQSQVAGPGGSSKPPVDVAKIQTKDPTAIPGGFDSTSMKNQKLLQDNVPKQSFQDRWNDTGGQFPPQPTPGTQPRLYVGPNLDAATPSDDVQPVPQTPNNSDFLDKSEQGSGTDMMLKTPVINDTGGIKSDSAGRSSSNVRSDLQDIDDDMQTAMDDHYNGGDFPGLGDQSNSDTDTAFA